MKELDLITFFYVFQEMLGAFLWPLFFIIVFLVLAFLFLLAYEKKIVPCRFKASLIIGVLGAIFGVIFLMNISSSLGLSNIAGPLDWFMLIGTVAGGFVGGAVVFYTLMGWIAAIRGKEFKMPKRQGG